MMESRLLRGALILGVAAAMAAPATAQTRPTPSNSRFSNGGVMQLAPTPMKGEPVAPFMEGWFENADGTYTFSIGYFNLNGDEALDVPVGPDNFIEPAEFNGNQPTHFAAEPRRERGVFAVTVPASWGDGEETLVWRLNANGKETHVTMRVGSQALQLDRAPRAMGSVPPELRFSEDDEPGGWLTGVWAEPMTATVGEPLELRFWAREMSERFDHDVVNTDVPVTGMWFKYSGPVGEVIWDENKVFEELTREERIARARAREPMPVGPGEFRTDGPEGWVSNTATFTAPGEYVLRARVDNHTANDSSGGDQCCWSNAYVRVTVEPAG